MSISYLQQPTSPKATLITAACETADVLGPDVRASLIARYTALLLAEYRRIFRLTDEAGQLDNISRRFAWFRRTLSTHEGGLGRAFLEQWNVGQALVVAFVDVTRYSSLSIICCYILTVDFLGEVTWPPYCQKPEKTSLS